jgi:nucleotide sugar dehydrogenase
MPHFPGCGVGGHCIPVDPYYLIQYAESTNGFDHKFLKLAREINNSMPGYTVRLLKEELVRHGLSLKNSKVALLGLAYKPDIDDCRNSPAFTILNILTNEGAEVRTFDPHVQNRSTTSSLNGAIEGADAVLIATGHKFFIENITPELIEKSEIKVLVDGRNCIKNPDSFAKSNIAYRGIGRNAFSAEKPAANNSTYAGKNISEISTHQQPTL